MKIIFFRKELGTFHVKPIDDDICTAICFWKDNTSFIPIILARLSDKIERHENSSFFSAREKLP